MTGFDLQSHSICSDGELAPAEVVAAAARAGVSLLALTDHDTVAGVQEALDVAEANQISIVPAVELSSVDGAHEELHILGYGVDHTNERFVQTLTDLRGDRERRVMAMAGRLREEGFALSDQELIDRRAAGAPLGRPHLAKALLSHPDNQARLTHEGISGPRELFPAYLVPGALCYVARSRPTVADAIELIHDAGGIAVWAHPFWDIKDHDEVTLTLRRFAGMTLDGVEAFYPTHDRPQVGLLCGLADELSLYTTGSSDFHGPDHEMFSKFLAFSLYDFAPRLGPVETDAHRQSSPTR